VKDWVTTAPTPDSTHGQPAPTNGQQVWIAIPNRPLSGSLATIEYVIGSVPSSPGGACPPRDTAQRLPAPGVLRPSTYVIGRNAPLAAADAVVIGRSLV
jgi:hypothetical protein